MPKPPTFRLPAVFKALLPLVALMIGIGGGAFRPAQAAAATPRYYMVMFGAQNDGNAMRMSHTFATFVETVAGVVTAERTISWLPAPGYFGPDFSMPRLGVVPGHNYTLDQTLQSSPGRHILYWGPIEVAPQLFARADAAVSFLALGVTNYKMFVLTDDELRLPAFYHQPGGTINCIMAVSDVVGYAKTGTTYGYDASQAVLQLFAPYVLNWAYDTQVAAAMRLPQRLAGH